MNVRPNKPYDSDALVRTATQTSASNYAKGRSSLFKMPSTNSNNTTTTTTTSSTSPHSVPPPAQSTHTKAPRLRPSLSDNNVFMHVVVLGAGFSGLSIAMALARDLPRHGTTTITLVEPKPFIEIRWESIRAMFDPTCAPDVLVPLSKLLDLYPSVSHLRAKAVSVDIDSVTLSNGTKLNFDILLIATGAVYKFDVLSSALCGHDSCDPTNNSNTTTTPTNAPVNANDDFHITRRKIQLAQFGRFLHSFRTLLIVAHGPIGCELAAELAMHSVRASKNMRIIVADKRPSLALSKALHNRLEKRLRSLGVELYLNETPVLLSTPPEASAETADRTNPSSSPNRLQEPARRRADDQRNEYHVYNGTWKFPTASTVVTCDYALFTDDLRPHCIPTLYNSALTTGSSSRTSTSSVSSTPPNLTPTPTPPHNGKLPAASEVGWIKVDAFGRVLDTRGNIFAAGDVCDAGMIKSAENALSNRHTYAHNIRVSLEAFATMKPLATIDGRLRKISPCSSHEMPECINGQHSEYGTERDRDDSGDANGEWSAVGGFQFHHAKLQPPCSIGSFGRTFQLPTVSVTVTAPWTRYRSGVLKKARKEIGF